MDDTDARDALRAQEQREAFFIAYRLGANKGIRREDLKDFASEVCRLALKSWDTFADDGGVESRSRWLRTIASNYAASLARKRRVRASKAPFVDHHVEDQQQLVAPPRPDALLEAKQRKERRLELFEGLSPQHLAFLPTLLSQAAGELTVAEAARALGISEASYEKRATATRKALTALLEAGAIQIDDVISARSTP